jgi:hypothetical protein
VRAARLGWGAIGLLDGEAEEIVYPISFQQGCKRNQEAAQMNDEPDDIKALIKIVKNLDGKVASIEKLMREIKAQMSYMEELEGLDER